MNKGLVQNNSLRIKLNQKYLEKYTSLKAALKLARKNKDRAKGMEISRELDKLPKNSSKVRIRNRCLVTERSGGLVLYKKFLTCGFKLREHINKGFVPGTYKV